MGSRATRPRIAMMVIALLALALLAGCTVPPPEGPGQLRYRDQLFSAATKTSDLTYGSAPNAQGNPVALKLDLYQPTGDTATKRPALVWVHGGGFTGGSKTGGLDVDVSNTFAKKGYVVVSIDYRLLGSGRCAANPSEAVCQNAALAAKHDSQAAVRWLRANASTYRVDPTRISMGGASAGAITATLAGLFSEDVGSSGNPGQPSTIRGFVSVAGGLPDGQFASAGDAPGLLFHGTADTVVPADWSRTTAVKMLQNGVGAWLQLQEGAPHVPWGSYRTLYVDQMTNFLYLVQDLGNAQGQPASAARAADRQEEALEDKYGVKLEKKYPKLDETYKKRLAD